MKKRFFTVCLSIIMLLMLLPTDALAVEGVFSDVAATAFYYEPVKWAVSQGVTKGTTNTTFSPNRACTRAEAVTFLWRACDSPEPSISECPFTDLPESAFYYKAALWAYENKITSGVSSALFGPSQLCTRSQIVTFLYRMNDTPSVSGSTTFRDVPSGSFYEHSVNWAAQNGITTGTSKTQFSPNNNCTRGEIVTFLYRSIAKDIDWNFLFLIFPNVDITYTDGSGQTISEKTSMSDNEIALLKRTAQLFEEDLYEMSRYVVKPHVTVEVAEVPIAFDDLTYSDSLGYYLDGRAVSTMLPASIDLNDYDHVTVFADIDNVETKYWGLGGTTLLQGTGFSFINNFNTEYAMWAFDEESQWAPAIIVHEFLHYMETWSRICGCPIPISADSGESLGYTSDTCDFKDFYTDFITHEVKTADGITSGVPCGIWRRPPHLFS